MTKKRRARSPARGRPWSKAVKAAALKALREAGNLPDARDLLLDRVEFTGNPPASSTLRAWAQAAGIELHVEPSKTRDTTEAVKARLARLDAERRALSEVILAKLSGPAARLIERRMSEETEIADIIDAAKQAFTDALKVHGQAVADYGTGSAEVKGSRRALSEARADLNAVMGFRLDVHTLVGVLTRGIADHLALEGITEVVEGAQGDVVVQFSVPRPARPAEPTPEHELVEEDHGGG